MKQVPMSPAGTVTTPDSNLAGHMRPLLLLAAIFFINFIGRIIQAPLMPIIEEQLQSKPWRGGVVVLDDFDRLFHFPGGIQLYLCLSFP